jgi:Mn2+/Fe2+ NRAMP family transporter
LAAGSAAPDHTSAGFVLALGAGGTSGGNDARGSDCRASKISRLLSLLGPGLITGVSDDDPSGIVTYSQVGAQFGFSISWTMMAAIQEISGRIGHTTG